MKKIISLFVIFLFIMGLVACKNTKDDNFHLGVNATIKEINTEKSLITIKGTDVDSFLGEDCDISCEDIGMIYCNYKSGEVKQISLQDLQVGDEIILGIRESEINQFLKNKGVLKIEQLQLGTQRLD